MSGATFGGSNWIPSKLDNPLVGLCCATVSTPSFTFTQKHGILRKSWRVFHDRLLLGRWFRLFVLPVLEYYSAVRCSAADTQVKLLDRVFSCASFLTWSVFECDICSSSICVSIIYAVQAQVKPDALSLWCSTCVVFASAGYTRCFVLTSVYLIMRLLAACRTSLCSRPFFSSRCLCWTKLLIPYSMVFDWLAVKSRTYAFLLA